MELSVVMPVYNEETTIVEAVRRALDADVGTLDREIIVVDDGSRDRTLERFKAESWPPEVQLVELGANHGKGYAVRQGAQYARGTYLAVLDADFEYSATDYAKLLPPLRDDGMDAAIGTRIWQAHSAFGYWYVMGNRGINTVCNVLFNSWLSDFGAGPKMLRTDLFRSLDLRENGFGFDAELVARLLKAKRRIYEVPVYYRARTREEGKKITAMDGVRILGVFFRVRLR
jgi:glycosyltransferase involved in cell wall biosynthesis